MKKFNLKENVELNLKMDLKKLKLKQLKESIKSEDYMKKGVNYITNLIIF